MKIILILVTYFVIAIPVNAGIGSDLKDMMSTAATRGGSSLKFTDSTSISPGDVGGFNRTAVDLGGMRLRTPVKSFNLVSFTKPNMSAGCSGVDITLGSFSFLSKDELIAMLRSIASNALTYAFGQSIKAMCEGCWTMMNTLQQKMQDLNQMFANTCNTAKCIMDDGCSTEGLGNLACLYSTGFSNDSDYAKCKDEAKAAGARADVAARAEANKAAGEGIDFLMGNLTYDMIGKSSPDLDAKLAGFASLFNLGSMTPKELVISMIGTVIVDESGKAETKLLPLIGFPELFENKGDETDPTGLTSKYYQCGAAQEHSLVTYECMTMESKDISRTVTNVDKLITDSLDDLISALEAFDAATLDGLQPMPRYLLNFIEPHLINAIVLTGKEKTNQVLATDLIKQKKLYIAAAVKDDFSNAVINVIKTLLVKGHQNRLTTTGVEILNQRLKELVAQRNKFREDNKDAFKFIEKTQSWHTLKRLYTSSLATKISDIMSKE